MPKAEQTECSALFSVATCRLLEGCVTACAAGTDWFCHSCPIGTWEIFPTQLLNVGVLLQDSQKALICKEWVHYILSKTQDLLKIPQIEILSHHGLPTQIPQCWKTLHVISLYSVSNFLGFSTLTLLLFYQAESEVCTHLECSVKKFVNFFSYVTDTHTQSS